jgi:hypothetical protein
MAAQLTDQEKIKAVALDDDIGAWNLASHTIWVRGLLTPSVA